MRLIRLARCCFASLWLIGSVAAVQANTGPQPTINEAVTVINLAPLLDSASPPGSAKLGGTLVISVRGAKPDRSQSGIPKLKLEEALTGSSERVKVTFADAVQIKADAASTEWASTFEVSGMPPSTPLTRYVKFKLGTVDWTLPFQILSPAAEPQQSWSVKPWPVGGRALEPKDGLPLLFSVPGQAPRAPLKVATFDLVEQSTKESTAASDWKLCQLPSKQDENDKGACTPVVAGSLGKGTHEIRIKPPNERSLAPGKYEGVLVISTDGAPDGVVESINVSLYASSISARWKGFFAILCGVLFSTLVTALLRRWIDRNRLLIPASVLRQSVTRLQSELSLIIGDPASPRPKTPNLDSALVNALRGLSYKKLETHGLPSSIPLPWIPIEAGQIDLLKNFLDAQAAVVLRWQVIIERGIFGIEALRKRHGSLGAAFQAYKDAYEDLDSLAASTALDAAAIGQRVDEIVQTFKEALAPKVRNVGLAAPAFAQIDSPLPTPERLRLKVKEGSVLTWLAVLVVTVGAGCHLLILSNPGFGTTADLLNCLFWGLGLATGAAAVGISANSVITNFNMAR